MSKSISPKKRLTWEIFLIIAIKIAVLYTLYLICFAHPPVMSDKVVSQYIFFNNNHTLNSDPQGE